MENLALNFDVMKVELMNKSVKDLRSIAKGLELNVKGLNQEGLVVAILKGQSPKLTNQTELGLDDMLDAHYEGSDKEETEMGNTDYENEVLNNKHEATGDEFKEESKSIEKQDSGIVDKGVVTLSTKLLDASPFNFFKPLSDKKYTEMLESIKYNGVLVPIIVRPKEDGRYEILAGHNRVRATEEVGNFEIPAKVVEVDDDKAKEIIIDTNVVQRSELSPLEIARAYREKVYLMGNRQGVRSDVTGEQKGSTRDLVGKEYEVSGMTVERYMRLNNLIPALQQALEDGKINLKTGFDLGLVDEKTQQSLLEVVDLNKEEDVAHLNSKIVTKMKNALADKNKLSSQEKKTLKKEGTSPTFKPLTKSEVKSLVKEKDTTEKEIVVKLSLPNDYDEDTRKFIISNDPNLILEILKDYVHGKLVESKDITLTVNATVAE